MKRILSVLLLIALLLPVTALGETAHELAYRQAQDCAFSSEYGDSGNNRIRKWTGEIRVCFQGKYNSEDVSFFNRFISQLEDNVPGLPSIRVVNSTSSANVVIWYAPLSQLPQVLTTYYEGNWGIFHFWYNNYVINKAQIGIASDKCTRAARNHLLMEEFVGLLGLANDHWLDKKSILYQGWTTTQALTDADWNMLRMLYDSRITPGMSRDDALRIMRTIY